MPDLQGIKKRAGKGKVKSANNQDFAKKKVKVGRKLEKTTETVTTFKAKRLSIAKQSVTSDRSGQEVNSKGLTLHELLVQTAHYAAAMRKESICGLRDFFDLHPTLLPVHAGAVFEKVSHFVTEQDAAVRKEFKAFISTVLECPQPASLRPFLPLYLVHVCGGMSHIHESIRLAAMSLLDDLIPSHPAIAADAAPQILPLFIHMLSEGETLAMSTSQGRGGGRAGQQQQQGPRLRTSSLQARMTVLASLKALLVASFGEEAGGGGGGGGEGGRGSQAEVQAAWQPKEQGGKVSLGVYRTPPGRAGLNYSTRNSDEGWADEAAESLLPLLTQAWEECSPGNVESKASLDCMLVVLAAARIIVRAVKWTPRASAFTRSLTACFPFTPETVPISVGARPADLAELCKGVCDVACCGLTVLCGSLGAGDLAVREALLAHVEESLQRAAAAAGEAEKAGGGGGGKGGKGSAAMDAASSLVSNLDVLLRAGSWGAEAYSAVEAASLCFESVPAGTRLASVCLRFVKGQLSEWPVGAPAQCARWISFLPRFLYSLSDKDPKLTLEVLDLLSSLAKRCTAFPQSQRDIESLQPMLVPFFRAAIRKRGATTYRPGPFSKLNEACQEASLTLLHYLAPLSESLLAAVAAVCGMEGVTPRVVDRAMDVVGGLGDAGRQAPAEAVSFIVTVGMLAQGDGDGGRGAIIAGMCAEQLRRRHIKEQLPVLIGPLVARLLGKGGCEERGEIRCLVQISTLCHSGVEEGVLAGAVVRLVDAGGGGDGDAEACAEVLSLAPGALVRVALEMRRRAEGGQGGGDALAGALFEIMRSRAVEAIAGKEGEAVQSCIREVEWAAKAGEAGGLGIVAVQKLAAAAAVLTRVAAEARELESAVAMSQ